MDDNDMSDVLLAALLIINLTLILRVLKKKGKNKRRWGVRPINRNRDKLGEFETLFQEIKNYEKYFFKYTRMRLQNFNYILRLVSPHLTKTSLRKPLTPEYRLAITLKYLSTGNDIFTLASCFRIGESTARNVIAETCIAIIKVLAPKYLKYPTRLDWLKNCNGYMERWNLPNCGGAVDGKHITIRAPPNSGSLFFNYKKTYSIILMAVCDFEYKFTLVDIGAYGSTNDGGIFEQAQLSSGLFNGLLDMPEEPIKLPNSNLAVPCYLAADDAFPLAVRLMKPYAGSYLDERKRISNYLLSRGRGVIENTFGILARRWRVFHQAVAVNPDKMSNIVMATVCLHNYLMTVNNETHEENQLYCPPSLVDREVDGRMILGWRFDGHDQLQAFVPRITRHGTREAHNMRDALSRYFNSPVGAVPWQLNYVRRGLHRDISC